MRLRHWFFALALALILGLTWAVPELQAQAPPETPTPIPAVPISLELPPDIQVRQVQADIYRLSWGYVRLPDDAKITCQQSADEGATWIVLRTLDINQLSSNTARHCSVSYTVNPGASYPSMFRLRLQLWPAGRQTICTGADEQSVCKTGDALRLPSLITGLPTATPIPEPVEGIVSDLNFNLAKHGDIAGDMAGFVYPTEPRASIILMARYRAQSGLPPGADTSTLPPISDVIDITAFGPKPGTAILAGDVPASRIAEFNQNRRIFSDHALPLLFDRSDPLLSLNREEVTWLERRSDGANQDYQIYLKIGNAAATVTHWTPSVDQLSREQVSPDWASSGQAYRVTYPFPETLPPDTVVTVSVIVQETVGGQRQDRSVDNRLTFNTQDFVSRQDLLPYVTITRVVLSTRYWPFEIYTATIFPYVNNGWGDGIVMVYIPQVYNWNNFEALSRFQRIWGLRWRANPAHAHNRFPDLVDTRTEVVKRTELARDQQLLVRWLQEIFAEDPEWRGRAPVLGEALTAFGDTYLNGVLPNWDALIGRIGTVADPEFNLAEINPEGVTLPDDAVSRGLKGLNALIGEEPGMFMAYILGSIVCIGFGFLAFKWTRRSELAIFGVFLAAVFGGVLGIVPDWLGYTTATVLAITAAVVWYVNRS